MLNPMAAGVNWASISAENGSVAHRVRCLWHIQVDHPLLVRHADSIVGLPTLAGSHARVFSTGYDVDGVARTLKVETPVACSMGMSELLTAVFAAAAIVVAYHLGLQEGLSLSAEPNTAQREDPSDPLACREH
jgi:hypothetical protein